MKYRPTILNVLSGGLLIWMIIQFIIFTINSTGAGGEAWGVVAIIVLVFLSIIGLGIDFLIQLGTKKLKTKNQHITRNGIGLILLIGLYYFNQNHRRDLNIIIPNDYNNAIGIVYDFPESDKLPVNILTLHSNVELPKSGLIFTSSRMKDNDIPHTKFINENGDLRYLGVNGIWERRYSDEIQIDYKGGLVTVRIINVGDEETGREKIAECETIIRNKLKKYATQQGVKMH